MSVWNGAFLGPLFSKHRDYEHASFEEHMAANGMIVGYLLINDDGEVVLDYRTADEEEFEAEEVDDAPLYADEYDIQDAKEYQGPTPFLLDMDPLTREPLDPPGVYYALIINLHGHEYRYYVPAEPGERYPKRSKVREILDRYAHSQDVDRDDIEYHIVNE